jgi:DNA-directed RNA polymerase specialized sigma24 family protein
MADRTKGKRGRSGKGSGSSRGVLREIDERLAVLDGELAALQQLAEERARLVAARAALTVNPEQTVQTGQTGQTGQPDAVLRRLTRDEIADYLRAHPGSKAGAIARAFEVPLTNVSQHLYRGKRGLFEARGDGWHLRDD